MIVADFRVISNEVKHYFPDFQEFFCKKSSSLQNSFHKIGGASEKKIEQALFFPLGLHYFG